MKLILSLFSAALLVSCTTATTPGAPSAEPPPAAPAAELAVHVERAVPADAPLKATTDGLVAFGYALHDRIAKPSENTVISPLSIGLAFGMARAGAKGETAAQIDEVLHFPPRIHDALNALEQGIVSGEAPPPLPEPDATRDATEGPQPPVVTIANGLFAQEGVTVKRPFLEILARHYGAGVRVVDFEAGTAKAAIDAWVRERTADRIEKLFDEIPPDTRVVLANAIYLKADWEVPFVEEPVRAGPFTLTDGTVVDATMMRRLDTMRYAEGDGWQAVEIPYAGDELAMLLLVPEGGRPPAGLLAPSVLADVDAAMHEGVVDLELPRWDFATDLDLKSLMMDLGMELPFDPAADFSGMTELDLFIDQAIHRANITVDEWGTEAAAVTGIGFDVSGPPEPEAVIHADHPFAFVIRHTPTGTPLFIGQVADPTKD